MRADDHPFDDAELMSRTARGDEHSFVVLVRRYQAALLNFFRSMGARHEAQDFCQETFIRLHAARERYKSVTRIRTLLYTIARHVWIDHLRRTRVRDATLQEWSSGMDETDAVDPAAAGARIDVREAVARLPARFRIVIVLAVFEGLSYAEIAEVLDIAEGTVKWRVHAAMSELRKFLEAHERTRK